MRRVGREACSSLTRRHLTDTAALDQPAAPGSAVIFFSSSAAENWTSDPVCPDFASAEADVVLRTADVSDHSYWSAGKQLPTLFRVKRNFLAMVSPVFRDMFAVCATEEASKAGAVERAVIELEEGAWEIRFMLLAHDEDIARHPDVNRVGGRMMVVLMELAVKFGLSMWQKSLETIVQSASNPTELRKTADSQGRYRLPMYGSTEVAEVLSWALRHQRRAVIMAAVDRIVDLPQGNGR